METNGHSHICLVEDDDAVRTVTAGMLKSAGYTVRDFSSAEKFLAAFDDAAVDCIVTDLRMPNIDGLELQRRVRSSGSVVAIVVVSGHADVPSAVQLMQDGAVTVLEKPYRSAALVEAVSKAVERTRKARQDRADLQAAQERYERLTDDEKAVLDYMVAGLPNKAIAMRLDLSMRTVDRRRSTVMKKLDADTVSDLAMLLSKVRAAR